MLWLKIGDFYEKEKVINEVVEARRSGLYYNLIIDLIAKDADNRKRKKTLDEGCGNGSFIRKFKEVCDVFGVSIYWIAAKEAKETGVNAYMVNVSSEKLPYEDRYFGLAYDGDVIGHIIDPDSAIRQVKRVLKRGGF